jgi:flagellar biosynthesis protein FlhG
MIGDQAENLRAAAGVALGRLSPSGPHACRVLAVTGGKGGVGKTNIAVNLSLALCEAGARVLLLDADLGLANADLLLGLNPRYTLQNVVHREVPLESIVVEGPLGLKLLPGGTGLPEMASLSTMEILRLLGAMRSLEAELDFLVIDTAAGIGHTVLRFALAADDVVLVCTPEPPAMLDAYGVIKALNGARCTSQLQLLVNMVRHRREALDTHRTLAVVAGRYMGLSLGLLGGVPLDDNIVQCIKQQVPFFLKLPQSHAARELRRIAAGFINEAVVSAVHAREGFFTRLVNSMR